MRLASHAVRKVAGVLSNQLLNLAVVVITAASMLVTGAVGAGAANAEPAPPHDSFYELPAGWKSAERGEVLKSRPVHLKQLQVLPLNVRAWQLLYRTTGQHGEAYAAVTTVMIPQGAAKPRPLLSYQAATDSVLRICNPSYGLTRGFPVEPSNPAGPLPFPTAAAEIALAAAGLEQGWAVAMPDHGGVDNRFLTPHQPGYAVLDGVRAVESFKPLKLDGAKTRVGLMGYSGGAIASSWAIEEQPTYAPELNIQGAAFGAAERDLEASLRDVNGTPLAGLIPLALGAVLKDQPDLMPVLKKYITKAGIARIQETRNHCMTQNVLANLWFDYHQYFKKPLSTILNDPKVAEAFTSRGITGRAPTVPTYIYNGVTEEVGPIRGADRMVRSYCRGGTPVVYRREALPPRPFPKVMTTHGTVAVTGAPGAIAWMKTRLSTAHPKKLSGCDTKTVQSSLLNPDAMQTLGSGIIANTMLSAIGWPIGSQR